jgi:hypothetical protein
MAEHSEPITQTKASISNVSVVAATAGILKSDSLGLSPEEERAATEYAIAEEVQRRSGNFQNVPITSHWPVTPQGSLCQVFQRVTMTCGHNEQ